MKRSVAMMACVLSGAMVLGSFSPVMAETGAKAVSATVTDSKSSDDKKDDAKADTADKKDDAKDTVLEDGTYSAEFNTDSGMFHVNEANDGKGTLTVKDGKMTIHVSLNSKKIVNLFVGKAEDAQKDGAEILEPTTDEVTYSDGYKEEVYGFDIQPEAIQNTQKLLRQEGLDSKAELICDSHERIMDYVKEPVHLVIFNLGYLPGGDKDITTGKETTLTALKQALAILKQNGLLCAAMYWGHLSGKEERKAVLEWASKLDKGIYHCVHTDMINQTNCPPELLFITRKR